MRLINGPQGALYNNTTFRINYSCCPYVSQMLLLLSLLGCLYASDSFLVVTKNVLADQWTNPNYYPYAGPEVLSWNRRFPAHLQEFTGYNADLLLLQEVDRFNAELTCDKEHEDRPGEVREGFWEPALVELGYACHFKEQTPKQVGVMVAHKIDRWEQVEAGSIDLGQATVHLDWAHPYQATFKVLQDKLNPGKGVIACTTHLFYRSAAIRTHQVIIMMRGLAKLRESYPDLPIVLTGDFNMKPADCARKLIIGSPCLANDTFWREEVLAVNKPDDPSANPDFDWSQAKQLFGPGGELSQLIAKDLFEDCEGLVTTHRTGTFDGILDYVFAFPALAKGSSLKMIAYRPIPADVAPMPNEQQPSDHLALVGLLQYK